MYTKSSRCNGVSFHKRYPEFDADEGMQDHVDKMVGLLKSQVKVEQKPIEKIVEEV